MTTGAMLVVAVACLLVLVTGPISFGMGTDCTDNANRGCQVVTRGAGTNVALQVVIAAAFLWFAGRRPARTRTITVAAVALCVGAFVGTMLYAHSYPRGVTYPPCSRGTAAVLCGR